MKAITHKCLLIVVGLVLTGSASADHALRRTGCPYLDHEAWHEWSTGYPVAPGSTLTHGAIVFETAVSTKESEEDQDPGLVSAPDSARKDDASMDHVSRKPQSANSEEDSDPMVAQPVSDQQILNFGRSAVSVVTDFSTRLIRMFSGQAQAESIAEVNELRQRIDELQARLAVLEAQNEIEQRSQTAIGVTWQALAGAFAAPLNVLIQAVPGIPKTEKPEPQTPIVQVDQMPSSM